MAGKKKTASKTERPKVEHRQHYCPRHGDEPVKPVKVIPVRGRARMGFQCSWNHVLYGGETELR